MVLPLFRRLSAPFSRIGQAPWRQSIRPWDCPLPPRFAAAALWLPPDVHPDEEAIAALFQNSLPEKRQEQALSVLEKLDGYHPTEPFWYLPFIGADPTQQRKGYGSALLNHVLDACDQEGAVAYLELSNPLNISLYVRHGFEVLGMIQEDTMPTLIPMERKPQV